MTKDEAVNKIAEMVFPMLKESRGELKPDLKHYIGSVLGQFEAEVRILEIKEIATRLKTNQLTPNSDSRR